MKSRQWMIALLLGALMLAACATPLDPALEPTPTPMGPTGGNEPEPAGSASSSPEDTVVSPAEPGSVTPTLAPWDPQPGDENLTRGNVFIDSSDILTLESFPPQFVLSLEGNLPTPCNQLRVNANPPDDQNRIQIEVYSVVDPDRVCVQVLEPFQVNIPLGTFPQGEYEVWVNGEKVGEIMAP